MKASEGLCSKVRDHNFMEYPLNVNAGKLRVYCALNSFLSEIILINDCIRHS